MQRLVAPNASLMTGPGTNTYLLGTPAIAVLDPGPNDASHIEAILAAAPVLEHIVVTHTHGDHSPAAAALARRTSARVIGRPGPDDGRQDTTFRANHVPQHEERLAIAGLVLRVLATPGHASNHVCYLVEGDGLLFSGDHILDGVTPVILAPDGDMAAYLDSLRVVREAAPRAIAPGHGRVLEEPARVIDRVIAHRMFRERLLRGRLRARGAATIDELLPAVYPDVRRELWPMARCTLEAHLVKLEREGAVRREDATWYAS